jgi:hypothetical protein
MPFKERKRYKHQRETRGEEKRKKKDKELIGRRTQKQER